MKLMHLQQLVGESAVQLCIRLEKIACCVHMKLDKTTMVQVFSNAFQMLYKKYLVLSLKTLQKAVEKVFAFEDFYANNNNNANNTAQPVGVNVLESKLKHPPPTTLTKGVTKTCSTIGNSKEFIQYLTPYNTLYWLFFSKGKPICSWCLQLRHIARECANKTTNKPAAVCKTCKKKRHLTDFCEFIKNLSTNTVQQEEQAVFALYKDVPDLLDIEGDVEELWHLVQQVQPLTVRLLVHSTATDVIVDTGASISVVSGPFLDKVLKGFNMVLASYKGSRIVTASGDALSICGTVELSIHLNNTTLYVTVVVTENMLQQVLLSMDALHKHSICIDFNTYTVHFRTTDSVLFSITQNLIPRHAHSIFRILATHSTILWVTVPKYRSGKMWLVAASANMPVELFVVATVVMKQLGELIPVQAVNLSHIDVVIPAIVSVIKLEEVRVSKVISGDATNSTSAIDVMLECCTLSTD